MRRGPKIATVSELLDRTSEDPTSGAMRSVQSAEMTLPAAELQRLWTPMHLERLARTYWRFLTRATLGLVRVRHSDFLLALFTARLLFLLPEMFVLLVVGRLLFGVPINGSVVLLARPLKLLSFDAPEYELDADHGVVRWRIKRGLLVARSGRGGHGHLRIEVRRLPTAGADGGPRGAEEGAARAREDAGGEAKIRIEIEVANFHPAIASGFGRRVYNSTQARIHLFVTNGFLRSLARLDLAESKVGALTPTDS